VLVLDANILIRAVLGRRLPALIINYAATVRFVAPEVAFAEAREHLPRIAAKRRDSVEVYLALLESVSEVIEAVDVETYAVSEKEARKRLLRRDPDDWAVLATALAFNYTIWTEDTDFFGAGVATYTTDRVELFLKSAGTNRSTDASRQNQPPPFRQSPSTKIKSWLANQPLTPLPPLHLSSHSAIL